MTTDSRFRAVRPSSDRGLAMATDSRFRAVRPSSDRGRA